MRNLSIIFKIITILLVVNILTIGIASAQLNGFFLKPSGDTEDYMKYIRKAVTYSGTSYYTGYLTLSAYKNVTTGIMANTGEPVQKLQLQGGNILLCRTNTASTTPDINPTSRNGAILFSDNVTTANNWTNGKWGIEYDDQFSTGGLNFFKPVSSLATERQNFNLFISNGGNIGIGTGEPSAKFQVTDGDIYIEDIDRGIIMKSPDGNCWRGTLNNQGQLEFTTLPDCLTTAVSENKAEDKPLFRISPNPASGTVQISCTPEELSEFSEYSLFDSSGNQIITGKLDQTIFTLNIQGFAAGTYILNFSGTRKFWSEKVIVR